MILNDDKQMNIRKLKDDIYILENSDIEFVIESLHSLIDNENDSNN